MFHYNCENDEFATFSHQLDQLGAHYGDILMRMKWISLGGGLYFTKEGYPVEEFSKKLADFSADMTCRGIWNRGKARSPVAPELVTCVVDIVHNEIDIAIVDSSVEAHMLDLLIYRLSAKWKMNQPMDTNTWWPDGLPCRRCFWHISF